MRPPTWLSKTWSVNRCTVQIITGFQISPPSTCTLQFVSRLSETEETQRVVQRVRSGSWPSFQNGMLITTVAERPRICRIVFLNVLATYTWTVYEFKRFDWTLNLTHQQLAPSDFAPLDWVATPPPFCLWEEVSVQTCWFDIDFDLLYEAAQHVYLCDKDFELGSATVFEQAGSQRTFLPCTWRFKTRDGHNHVQTLSVK